MKSNKQMLLEGPILASLLKLAIPIMVVNILQAAYQLVDAFGVGRLGGTAVAAVSVSTPVIFLTMALGIGLPIGSILIAQYFGAGNQKMVNQVAAQTLLMVISVSDIVTIVFRKWAL